jgi:hypothetical protein
MTKNRSRAAHSVVMSRLSPELIEALVSAELDRVALGHTTFTPKALSRYQACPSPTLICRIKRPHQVGA